MVKPEAFLWGRQFEKLFHFLSRQEIRVEHIIVMATCTVGRILEFFIKVAITTLKFNVGIAEFQPCHLVVEVTIEPIGVTINAGRLKWV